MIATGEAGIQHKEINRVVDDTNNVDDLPRIPDENVLDVS